MLHVQTYMYEMKYRTTIKNYLICVISITPVFNIHACKGNKMMPSNHDETNPSNCSLARVRESIESNLSWHPTIHIQSTHFYHPKSAESETHRNEICVIDKATDHNTYLVNVALFLDNSISASPTLSYIRSQRLGYPPNAVLEIENFIGVEEEKNVVNVLKNAAAAGGTVLVVEKVRKSGR
jgi:hypothetical protein